MDTARLLTQLPLIMGLSSAALMLIFILSLSTPLATVCSSSPYSFPAIKSMCVEYVCSMWSLLRNPTDQQPHLFSSRNLFLLVNVIVFVLLINLHLQQHAAPAAAAGKRSSRRKKHRHAESSIENEKAATPLQVSSLADDHAGPAAAAAMAKEALSTSVRAAELDSEEISIAEPPPMQVSDAVQEFSTVDSGRIDCSDTEQIVMDENGRLRLIGRPNSPTVCSKGGDAESSENGGPGLIESGKGVDAKEEEDGQPRLIEPPSKAGSDAEEIVPEEVGRLRSIPRPASRPRKSHSTGDKNVDEPSEGNHLNGNSDSYTSLRDSNYDSHTRSLSHSNDNNSSESFNYDKNSNLNELINELNNGTLVIDLSSSPNIPQDPKKEDAPHHSGIITQNLKGEDALHHHSSSKNKSSTLKRTSSRPMRAKKSESLEATWKAINKNKGIGESKPLIRQSSRENKHLIRQSSRQDFKPSGRGRASSSNSSKVRREPSISQEELNSKVESFIAKFNEQIRIQRQQSILSYMQMVDRGA